MSVLSEAEQIVAGPRRDAYGPPIENHGATADMVTVYLRRRGLLAAGASLDARDVCWINALQKISRDAHDRRKDNLVDVAGYVRNIELLDE